MLSYSIPTSIHFCAELQKQLDAVDRELEKRETAIQTRSSSVSKSIAGPTSIKFANNSIVKPGSNICGSGFTWAGAYKTSNSRTYDNPQKLFEDEKIRNHKRNIQTEYGMFTKECDLPTGNINVNKLAPYDRRCTLSKEELQQRIPYSDMSVKEYIGLANSN